MNDNPILKIILPVREIPLNATTIVTKIRGEKQYTLSDRIRIFSTDGSKKEIKAEGGCMFLVSNNGDCNVIDSSVEIVWLAREWELLEFIEGPSQ